MSAENELDWLAELAKNAEALRQQIEESSEALLRQVDQLVRGAEQFVHDAWRITPSGPVPPFQRRVVVQAVGSVMRGLVPTGGYSARPGSFRGYAITTRIVTGGGSLVQPPKTIVADGDVGTATETASVLVVPTREPDLIERNIGRILALVLVAILTSGLLGVQGPDRAAVDHYLTVIGVALTIAVLIWAGHK